MYRYTADVICRYIADVMYRTLVHSGHISRNWSNYSQKPYPLYSLCSLCSLCSLSLSKKKKKKKTCHRRESQVIESMTIHSLTITEVRYFEMRQKSDKKSLTDEVERGQQLFVLNSHLQWGQLAIICFDLTLNWIIKCAIPALHVNVPPTNIRM